MSFPEIMSTIGTILLMVAVFVGAYFVSKYVGKHYQPHNGSSGNISVIESQSVGKDRALIIVKTADRAFLIGTTPREFTLISELDVEKLSPVIEEKPVSKDFYAMFHTAIAGKNKKNEGEIR